MLSIVFPLYTKFKFGVRVLLLLSLNSYGLNSFCQIELVNTKLPQYFIGIDNPVILIEGDDTLCGVRLNASSNIEINYSKDSCVYYVKPRNQLTSSFIEVGHRKFDITSRLDLIPDPVWEVPIENGFVNLNDIKESLGFILRLSYFEYDVRILVRSIHITVIRNNKFIYSEQMKNATYSNEFKELIRVGDLIDFSPIIINAPEGERTLESIRFTIK
ncbi:MAG: hypothetical protein CMP59_08185 [Flavobacteriales bacterium]|mgnify:CR=1 FL=1|nr:hypothetical protein [Flavobacteriales bacterium]|tara:strand:- start:1010 stop:1657 length:648 start_codon:yes stop_codon:yes gene_type:complete